MIYIKTIIVELNNYDATNNIPKNEEKCTVTNINHVSVAILCFIYTYQLTRMSTY